MRLIRSPGQGVSHGSRWFSCLCIFGGSVVREMDVVEPTSSLVGTVSSELMLMSCFARESGGLGDVLSRRTDGLGLGSSGRVVAWGRGAVCAGMGWGSITGETEHVFFWCLQQHEKRAPVMLGDMSSGAAGLAELYQIYKTEDSIVDGRRVPRKNRGWLRQWDVDIDKRRRIQHSAAAGGRRVSLEERMQSRRRALESGRRERTAGTESWSGRQRGPCAWRRLACFRFWGCKKLAGSSTPPSPWCGSTGSRAKPDMARGGRSFSQGGWCRSRLHRGRPTYSGRRIDWARKEPKTRRGLDLFFSCSQQSSGCRADRVSSCPGAIPICKWSTVDGEPVLCHVFERCSGRVDAKRENLVKSVETRRAAPGSHAPTNPRKPQATPMPIPTPNAELTKPWMPGSRSWPSRWQQPGKAKILRIAEGNLPGILFSAARMRQRQATARLTFDVENMSVRTENSFASASACCVLLVINLIDHDRFLAGA